MRITPTQGQSLTPFKIMYGRQYSIPDLAKTACHQYEDDETLASYMQRMFETKDISQIIMFRMRLFHYRLEQSLISETRSS